MESFLRSILCFLDLGSFLQELLPNLVIAGFSFVQSVAGLVEFLFKASVSFVMSLVSL